MGESRCYVFLELGVLNVVFVETAPVEIVFVCLVAADTHGYY